MSDKPETAEIEDAVECGIDARAALMAEYDRACFRYRQVSQKIEDAEDERDEIRRDCERLERELGL